MAENIENITVLLDELKRNSDLNSENYNKILTEIQNKVDSIQDNTDALSEVRKFIDTRLVSDLNKLSEIDKTMEALKVAIYSSTDYSELTEQVKTLSDNFKSGFNSVVNFANKDADAKNLLLDRMDALENAVKNGAMIETLRQRTDDLVKSYEHFISDSNLRHGNMVSALVDLKNKIEDYSSKNNYVYGTIEHTIADTNSKISGLESTVSSNLGNVNSKLYSMGDDIQKILNDGFDHLKYLSSNMSEAMNSNSLDFRTTMEALKANVMDYSVNLHEEFSNLNRDLADKLDRINDADTMLENDILDNVKRVENAVASKAEEYANIATSNFNNLSEKFKQIEDIIVLKTQSYETIVSDKVKEISEFINVLRDTITILKVENESYLNGQLNDLSAKLEDVNAGFEKLMVNSSDEIKNLSALVSQASDDVVRKIQETDIEEIVAIKDELLTSSSSNFNALIEKINDINESVEAFKNSTADNLSGYLETLKSLFVEFSSKVENMQGNEEVLNKLSNLEVIMSRFDVEKNDNFQHLQTLIENNASAIDSLKENFNVNVDFSRIESIIEEHSRAKDEKLNALQGLINNNSSLKDEKLNSIENLINDIDMSKDSQYQDLKNLISENSQNKDEKLASIEKFLSDINPGDESEKYEALKNIINGHSASKDEKLEEIKNLILEQNSSRFNDCNDIKDTVKTYGVVKDEKLAEISNIISSSQQVGAEKLDELKNLVAEYKNSLEKISDDIQIKSDETLIGLTELKNLSSMNSEDAVKNLESIVNNKLFEYKSNISDEINAVKALIGAISEHIGNISDNQGNTEISDKLLMIENQFTEYSQNYEQSLGILNSRLNEYVESVQNICVSVSEKLTNSEEEFGGIRSRFDEISNRLTNLVGNSGLIEILANIRQQFNILSEEISNEKDTIITGVHTSLSEILGQIQNNLSNLSQSIENICNTNVAEDVVSSINSGIVTIKEDVNSLAENISSAMEYKIKSLSEEFAPLEIAISRFADFDAEKFISETKEQIELSYVTLASQIKESLADGNSFESIEASYKDLVTKLSSLEEVVNDSINSNLETINNVLANVHNLTQSNLTLVEDIQSEFRTDLISLENRIKELNDLSNNSLTQQLQEIKSLVENNRSMDLESIKNIIIPAFDNDEIIDVIRGLNKGLADRITEMKQDSDLAAQDVLDVVNSVKNTVDYTLDVINDKFENSGKNASTIISKIDELDSKLALLMFSNSGLSDEASDDDSEKDEEEDTLAEDIIAIKESIQALGKESDSESEIESVLSRIDSKLDIIAQADNEEVLINIDDIKEDLVSIQSMLQASDLKFEHLIKTINEKFVSNMSDTSAVDAQDLSDNFDDMKSSVEFVNSNIENLLKKLDAKLDIIAQSDVDEFDISDVYEDLNEMRVDIKQNFTKLDDFLKGIDAKLDIIAQDSDDSIIEAIDSIRADIADLKCENSSNSNYDSVFKEINAKLDIIAQNDNEELIVDLNNVAKDIENLGNDVRSIRENISSSENSSVDRELLQEKINELKEQMSATEADLREYAKSASGKLDDIDSNVKAGLSVENIVKEISNKVDIIAMSDDNGVIEEISEIKEIVEAQLSALKEVSSDNTNNVYNKLSEELVKIDNNLKNIDLSKSADEIKESLMTAILSLTNGISFTEESEEIKDFVNERTNELHRMLLDVKHQLSAISNAGDDMELYSYTLQDVESDLAKLRLVVNDVSSKVSDSELTVVTTNLSKVTKEMEELKKVIVETEIERASRVDLNEELLSISSRLNKIILTQQETEDKMLEKVEHSASTAFGFDNKLIARRIEKHLSEIEKKLEYTVGADTVLKNVMMYLGEWMDGTTDTLSSIYDRCQISNITKDLMEILPEKKELCNFIESKYYQQESNIENLQNIVDNVVSQSEFRAEELQTLVEAKLMAQNSKVDELEKLIEEKINKQESRLDRIEMQLDKICARLDSNNDSTNISDKFDELDSKLARLSANIEKLASYVD